MGSTLKDLPSIGVSFPSDAEKRMARLLGGLTWRLRGDSVHSRTPKLDSDSAVGR